MWGSNRTTPLISSSKNFRKILRIEIYNGVNMLIIPRASMVLLIKRNLIRRDLQ